MGDKTGITWTDATWNPVTGCDRISPGCDRCYAMTQAARLKLMGQPRYQKDGDPRTSGPGFAFSIHEEAFDQPLRWTRPRTIFVNSMSDMFHAEMPFDVIDRLFDVMRDAHWHRFQVLTKRTKRMAEWSRLYYDCDHGGAPTADCSYCKPYPNVWLGTSIESNNYAFRADHLRETTAAIRFLSLEPLLGPLPDLDLTGIDWVIVGGESGKGARPMTFDWVEEIRKKADDAGAAFFFKQTGTVLAKQLGIHGKGDRLEEIPAPYNVQEIPA